MRVERELFESSLRSGRTVLEVLGHSPHEARRQAMRFRRHSIELLKQLAPLQGDEKKLIAAAKQGRQQLEQMWQRERDEQRAAAERRGAGFSPQDDAPRAAD